MSAGMDGSHPERLDRRESTDRNVGFLINDIARLMRMHYDRRMRALGLTRSQWWVLTHLYFKDGISQTELSDVLEVERATLGRMLDRLEAKGWVERRAAPADRRIKLVYLTGEVEALLVAMRARAADMRETTLAGLGAAERELLIDLLSRVKRNLVEQNGETAVGAANDAGVGVARGREPNA